MLTEAVKTSSELVNYHLIAFGVNANDCKLIIQGNLNFSYRGNSNEVVDQKVTIQFKLVLDCPKNLYSPCGQLNL